MRRTIEQGEPVTTAVVECVAEATDRDPTDLRPLAAVVDPDALESVFDRSPAAGPRRLEVLYEGCWVTVRPEAVDVESLGSGSVPGSGVPGGDGVASR